MLTYRVCVCCSADAQRARDGYDFGGFRLRVELAKGNFVSSASRGPPQRSGFRARITGLPESASWQVSRVTVLAWRRKSSPVT